MPTSKPVRIAYLTTELELGGAEKCLYQLVSRLDRAQWEPVVYALGADGPLAELLSKQGVAVSSLDGKKRSLPRVLFSLAGELRRRRPAILHTFLFHANVVGRLAAWAAGVPHVVSSIRVVERRFRHHLVLETLTCRLADRDLCVSEAVRQFTRTAAHVPASRLAVIPNGIDIEPYQSAEPADLRPLGVRAGAVVCLFVGRLDPQKGVEHLVEAAGELCSRSDRYHFLVAGEGPERVRLERRISELRLAGHVHLLGWRGDVPALMKASHVLVLPSLWEGMPNVVLEAMAAGLPVVATPVEGNSELVVDEETGILVPVGQSRPLAEAIARLASDPATRERMGCEGRRRVAGHYRLDHMIESYVRVYREVLGLGNR